MMTRTSPSPQTVLQWTFQYGNDLLTCGVERHSGERYVLSIVPNHGPASEMIETFDSCSAALRRHAVIATSLRNHGWTLMAYTGMQMAGRRGNRLAA